MKGTVLALGILFTLASAWAGDRKSITDEWKTDFVTPQRDQGQLGTCHAFACLPGLDFIENSNISMFSRQMNWITSDNWLVFLATVGKICDPNRDGVKINQGADTVKNAEMVLKYGYCERQMFSQYEKDDTARSLSKGSNLADVFRGFEEPQTGTPGAKGTYTPGLEKRFEESFGVTVDEARTLCGTEKPEQQMDALVTKVKARMANAAQASKMRASAFLACATQSKQKQEQLTKWECKTPVGPTANNMTGDEKVAAIKKLMDDGKAPIIVSMKNYPDGKPRNDIHGYHAFTLVGYDDTQKMFIVQNSWGAGNNMPVRYAQVENIYRWTHFDCPKRVLPQQPREKRAPVRGIKEAGEEKGSSSEGKGSGRSH